MLWCLSSLHMESDILPCKSVWTIIGVQVYSQKTVTVSKKGEEWTSHGRWNGFNAFVLFSVLYTEQLDLVKVTGFHQTGG